MVKRSVGWILAGFVLVAGMPFAAAGCGHSAEGDYVAICKASWSAANDCENISGNAVDLEKEYRNCENDSDNFAAAVEDLCGADYEILGDKVDRCIDSLNKLGQVCRDDHKSDYSSALSNASDDCAEDFIRCK